MKLCPECKREMQPGRLAVDSGLSPHTDEFLFVLNGLVGGVSPAQQCWFRTDDGSQDEVVLGPGDVRPAFRCKACSTIVITDPPREKLDWPNMRNYGSVRS